MKSDQKDCAPETKLTHWKSINWKQVKQEVKSLQLRIAKAIKEGKHNKARALQWLPNHSFAAILIRNLNPVITGWANFHRHACSKKTFNQLDRILWRNIWNWARRRHNNLGYRKIVSLLFMSIGNRK